MGVILASQSPRRKELLGLITPHFQVRVCPTEEYMDPSQELSRQVALVSREKARAINASAEDVVIAADTVVVLDGQVLGKPKDEEDAFRMLSLLSGRCHLVLTGMCVLKGDREVLHTETTQVHFRPLTGRQIRRYIATGEPMDKAGAYGIQGGAAAFVERIEGDYYNVMGLPVCRLSQILEQTAPELMEESE